MYCDGTDVVLWTANYDFIQSRTVVIIWRVLCIAAKSMCCMCDLIPIVGFDGMYITHSDQCFME